MFIRKYNFIRCGSRLLFGNLLVILIILNWRLFLVIPCFNRLLIRRTHGFRCRLCSCHLLRVFGAHAGRLFGSTNAISIGGCLRCSNFRLEECALWMRLWRCKSTMLYLVALSIFALVFVEVKWFSYSLRSILGCLRMRSKLNRMWHRHIWVIRSLDLKLLV